MNIILLSQPKKSMPRTIEEIEADINDIIQANPNWASNEIDANRYDALLIEKNQLQESISALLSKDFPDTVCTWGTVKSEIPSIFIDLQFKISEFGVIQEAIDKIKECYLYSLLLLTSMKRNYTLRYSTEADIHRYVIHYMYDLTKGLGIDDNIHITQGIQVTQIYHDIWLLYLMKGTPFLVLEIHKPQIGITQHTKVISRISKYMCILREYHGIGHVFGIISSIDKWRVCWLSDCDEIAHADHIVSDKFNPGQLETKATPVHGTEVLYGSSAHPIIISTIWKAHCGVMNRNSIINKPLIESSVIRVDQQSQTWEDLSKLNIKQLSMDPLPGNCKSFYLLIDLKYGSQGRVWLAISNTSREKYCLVVLKFSDSSTLLSEAQYWKAMGYSSQSLFRNELLCMPFGITCSKDGNDWDTTIWNQIKSYVPRETKELFEEALQTTKPKEALETAIASLKKNNVWHQDLTWRHLALLPKVKKGWFSNYPMTVEASFWYGQKD